MESCPSLRLSLYMALSGITGTLEVTLMEASLFPMSEAMLKVCRELAGMVCVVTTGEAPSIM